MPIDPATRSQQCKHCGTVKPIVDFYPTTYVSKKTGLRAHQSWCIPCYLARQRENMAIPERRVAQRARVKRDFAAWKERDPISFQASRRRILLKNTYGMTVAEWDRMLIEQCGKCAICDTQFLDKIKPCVDHDHATGAIRGLLCKSCNNGLGLFTDNPLHLINAATYLWATSPHLKKEGVIVEGVML